MSVPRPADELRKFCGMEPSVLINPSATSSIDVSYVAIHVSRRQQQEPRAWGLWITFVDDGKREHNHHHRHEQDSLIVGAVDEAKFNPLLEWSWITSNQPDLTILTNRSYGNNLWKTYFAMLPPLPDPHRRPHHDFNHRRASLMSGDVIISINGIPVTSFEGNINTVTDYLHGCNELFLVAVRDAPQPQPQQQQQQTKLSTTIDNTYIPPPSSALMTSFGPCGGRFASYDDGLWLWDPSYHSYHRHHNQNHYSPHHHHPAVATPFAHPCRPSPHQEEQILRLVTPPKAVARNGSVISSSTTAASPTTAAATSTNHLSPTSHAKTDSRSSHYQQQQLQQQDHSYNTSFAKPSMSTNAKRSLQMNNFGFNLNNNSSSSQECSHHKAATTDTAKMVSLAVPMEWTNPMFHKKNDDNDGGDSQSDEYEEDDDDDNKKMNQGGNDKALLYCDNHTFDPYDGSRTMEFLFPVNTWNFQSWLKHRKQGWRSKWNVTTSTTPASNQHQTYYNGDFFEDSMVQKRTWANPMFRLEEDTENIKPKEAEKEDNNNNNKPDDADIKAAVIKFLPYDDNYHCDDHPWFHPDEDKSSQFLVPINTSKWSNWLQDRKQKWRTKWKPYELEAGSNNKDCEQQEHQNAMLERLESCTVRYDFWTDRYSSFDGWLKDSKFKWKKSYSWNSRKRKRIQQVCEEVVQFPSLTLQQQDPIAAQQEFQSWLRVRSNQWRLLRRKRQRRLEEEAAAAIETNCSSSDYTAAAAVAATTMTTLATCRSATYGGCGGEPSDKRSTAATVSGDYRHIDALLEEEEQNRRSLEEQRKCRQPLDLSFLFLPSLGMSDDIAAHIVEYLDCSEHGKLLCINKFFGEGLQSRAYMWQLLCNRCPHWHLPRRPRKPWYKLYLSKIRQEAFAAKKQWDDLLVSVADVLFKGDQVKLVAKLIEKAIKKFSFTVDYVSGVVCERNSILNLAVIHKRHKVVKYLLEKHQANLETSDRGHFTPVGISLTILPRYAQLINAAWGGDKHMVRFLLSHGADRSKIGTGHYTEALAPSDFKGLTAEGWARKKGHDDIAELIRVGL